MILFVAFALSLAQAEPDSLSLERALALARTRRGAVQLAAAEVARARASARMAGTIPNPVGGYSYTEDTPRQHVSLDQSLEWLLTRGPERAAGQADLSRARADSVQALADLTANVQLGFYATLAAAEVERLTRDQSILADSMVVIARARFARGDIPLLEQDQVLLEATRAAQRRNRTIEAHDVARSRLTQLIGWRASDGALSLRGSLADGLESAASLAHDSATVLIPRLLAARHDSTAADARLRGASRAAIPLPTLSIGADWDDPTASHTPLAVLGFSIPVPLWQHGGGAIAQARADADRSNAELREVQSIEQQRLNESSIRLNAARGRALAARDSLLPIARRVRQRAAIAYQAGETGITVLLDALRAERDVAAEAVDDLLAWQEARATWRQARGYSE